MCYLLKVCTLIREIILKQYVLFGSGTVAEKNLRLNPAFIVDNNPDLIGSYFHGLEVKSPKVLDGRCSIYNVIVCTTSVGEVKRQLQSYGYLWDRDASAALLLTERIEMDYLESTQFNFLVSSGLPSSAESFSGGGIHLVQETDEFVEVTKIYEGNTHGLVKFEERFSFTCQGSGIIILNEDYTVQNKIQLRAGLRPHGIKRYNDIWVVVSSYQDSIVGIDDQGKEVFEFRFTDKLATYGSAQHHCNDLCIVGDYAYVSMFSVTGNWKRNSFDGGIIEINLLTGDKSIIINSLTMPHSITCDDDGFMVLNSFKGTLLGKNFDVLATFPGFVRGFDSDSDYYYIGESKNRNFSRMNSGRSPVSLDSRITVVDKKLSFSRSIALPKNISEIHAVLKVDAC